jgi:hypothetical protein
MVKKKAVLLTLGVLKKFVNHRGFSWLVVFVLEDVLGDRK